MTQEIHNNEKFINVCLLIWKSKLHRCEISSPALTLSGKSYAIFICDVKMSALWKILLNELLEINIRTKRRWNWRWNINWTLGCRNQPFTYFYLTNSHCNLRAKTRFYLWKWFIIIKPRRVPFWSVENGITCVQIFYYGCRRNKIITPWKK